MTKSGWFGVWLLLLISLGHMSLVSAGTQDVIRLGPPDAPISDAPVDTATSRTITRPMDKYARGIVNTVTGVFEIPVTIHQESRQSRWRGATVGLVRGVWRALWRTGVGLADIVTCFAPPYEHQWIQPTYVFHEDTPATWTWEELMAEDSPADQAAP